jgi:hypothetical protein
VTVDVGDADLAGLGSATVKFYSRLDSNGVTVALSETSRHGLFRGYITLVDANAPAGAKLRAANDETIRVEYLDESGNVVLKATAQVDTHAPGISGVAAQPDYEDIVVTWDTTEPTDALVQYGESPSPLGMNRTAYDDALDTYHELMLPGLQPDKTYYFQVVSRDAAGNPVVDDNGGNYYQATTFKPIVTPYANLFASTNLDGWSTYEGEDSQGHWTLGVPNNGVETAAVSPPYAWGSNLKGANLDYADAFLLSPAIQLTGGNRATLRFWDSYDFTDVTGFDILEGGLLYIFTNRTAEPITLATFGDTSGGWTEEEIDLTPYLGHVIYLVWHHQLLSMESAPRAGWLVDDVSISVSSIVPGTLAVSNNLSQAAFVLSGALSTLGQGNWLLLTNAPPGDYTVTFADVPYYVKPASQSGSLAAAGTLVLSGAYTMPDTNHNGISDTWEQQYLGSVTNGHLATMDSDRDGMSDLAEFIAGTNPTNALSLLRLSQPAATNGQVRLGWGTVPGRGYRILGSTDLTNWFAVVDWFRATNTTFDRVLTLSNQPPAMSLRLEVRP